MAREGLDSAETADGGAKPENGAGEDVREGRSSPSDEEEALPAELEGLYPPEAPIHGPVDAGFAERVMMLQAKHDLAGKGDALLKGTLEETTQLRLRKGEAGSEASPAGSGSLYELARNSPFIDLQHPIDAYELAKMVFLAPLFLFRALILLVLVASAYLSVMVILHVLPAGAHGLYPGHDALAQLLIHRCCPILLFLSGFYHIPIKGAENIQKAKEARSIVIFNHLSYVDPAALLCLMPLSGIAKAGVARIPFIGPLGVALRWLFVERRGSSDRSNPHTLKGDPIDAIRARRADRSAPLLVMAPEATTKAQQCLLKFRRGAFTSGCPVTPVLIRYRFRHFNPAWGLCRSTPLHVYRLLVQPVNHVSLEVLPPYFPDEQETKDWTRFASNVRVQMAQALQAPMVEQGIAEERRLLKAGVTTDLAGSRVIFRRKVAEQATSPRKRD